MSTLIPSILKNQFTRVLILVLLIFAQGCKEEYDWKLFKPEFDVYVLLPMEGLGDRSFVDLVYEGVEIATNEYHFTVHYCIPGSFQDAEDWILSIPILSGIEDKPSLVIVAGNQYSGYVDALNGEYGKNKVLLLAGSATAHEGLATVVYRSYASSYIGGYLSASMINNCRAVTIAAFDATFLSEYQEGFRQGVIDAGGTVSPTIFLSDGFAGFSMSDSAYVVTSKTLFDHELIFGLATGSNYGIINAARDYNQKRYVMGVDADQSWMGYNVVTGSVIVLFNQDIIDFIAEFSQGKFCSGNFIRSLADKKTDFLINPLVMKNSKAPLWLIEKAIKLENEFGNQINTQQEILFTP